MLKDGKEKEWEDTGEGGKGEEGEEGEEEGEEGGEGVETDTGAKAIGGGDGDRDRFSSGEVGGETVEKEDDAVEGVADAAAVFLNDKQYLYIKNRSFQFMRVNSTVPITCQVHRISRWVIRDLAISVWSSDFGIKMTLLGFFAARNLPFSTRTTASSSSSTFTLSTATCFLARDLLAASLF